MFHCLQFQDRAVPPSCALHRCIPIICTEVQEAAHAEDMGQDTEAPDEDAALESEHEQAEASESEASDSDEERRYHILPSISLVGWLSYVRCVCACHASHLGDLRDL